MPHAMPDIQAGPGTVGSLGVGIQTDRREHRAVRRVVRHTEGLGCDLGEAQEGRYIAGFGLVEVQEGRHTVGFGLVEVQGVRHIAGLGFEAAQEAHRTDPHHLGEALERDTRRRHTGWSSPEDHHPDVRYRARLWYRKMNR